MTNGTSGLVSQMNSIERIIAFVIVLVISGGSGVSVARYVQSKPVAIENIATKQDVKEAIAALEIDKLAKAVDVEKLEKYYQKNAELIYKIAEAVAKLTGYMEAKTETK